MAQERMCQYNGCQSYETKIIVTIRGVDPRRVSFCSLDHAASWLVAEWKLRDRMQQLPVVEDAKIDFFE